MKSDPHHVRRVAITEQAPRRIGMVRFSRTFSTRAAAQREADAWNNTGDWAATVEQGRAPRLIEQIVRSGS